MKVIDSHVHLYPPELNADPTAWAVKRGELHWAKLCTRRRKDAIAVQGFPCVEELLREMDRAGVERAVLLGWYWEQAETCPWQNRFYGKCVRAHPDRLLAYATIHPGAGHWPTLGELHRARDEGLVGIGELSPHSQGYGVDDPVLREVLTLAADWKMPVNLHVTDPGSGKYPGRVETPLADFVRRFLGRNSRSRIGADCCRSWIRTRAILGIFIMIRRLRRSSTGATSGAVSQRRCRRSG